MEYMKIIERSNDRLGGQMRIPIKSRRDMRYKHNHSQIPSESFYSES